MRLSIDPACCRFAVDVRVRWADTDAVGIAYNGAYLTWFEVARVEYARALRAFSLGVAWDDPRVEDHFMEERVETYTLAASTVNWLHPARVDMRLRVATRVAHVGRTSFDHEFVVTRIVDGAPVALGTSTQVRVDPEALRPTALDPRHVDALQRFERALACGEARPPIRMA